MRLNTDADVAARVRGVLGEQNMSGSELARRLNVSQRWLARRLAGQVGWHVALLQAVADELGVPIERFLRTPERAA